MNYSHLYSKLKHNELYTTIRKSCLVKVGDIEDETYDHQLLHCAKVLRVDKVKLSQLPTSVLIMDCHYEGNNINNRFDCYQLFQSFYYNKIDFRFDDFYIILLKKVK